MIIGGCVAAVVVNDHGIKDSISALEEAQALQAKQSEADGMSALHLQKEQAQRMCSDSEGSLDKTNSAITGKIYDLQILLRAVGCDLDIEDNPAIWTCEDITTPISGPHRALDMENGLPAITCE